MNKALYSSIFGELTAQVQARFDAVSELNKKLNDNVIYRNYLDWDTPSIGLDFNELIGKYGLSVVAPTIGINSKEPVMESEGFETLKESVLHHAISKPMAMTDYRKILQLLDSKSINDEAKKRALVNLMWKEVIDVVNAVEAKQDVIFLGALFGEGIFEFTDENNAEGGVRGTINYNQPAENIAKATTKWTEENLASVDPMEDIGDLLSSAMDKVAIAKILLDPARLGYICRAKKMKQMIWGTDKGSRLVTIADLNAYMASANLPTFEVLRRKVRVNGVDIKPYNDKNIVFLPAGKLGLVKNAFVDSELVSDPANGVAYSNYGRIRVSQWSVDERQNSNHVEFTKAEALSLPVITEFDGIFTLKTDYEDNLV